MWFAQVVQAYLGYRVVRAFLAPAEAADEALVRLKAISGATAEEMRAVTDFADAMAVATPFAFAQVVRGIEAAVRAGLNLAQAMEVVKAATGLAVAEGINLAEATEFLSQVMFSFQLRAEDVGQALNMIFEAARQSPYTFGQIRYALSLTMASASALNQSLESVLALISIFGKAGVPAAQAATMINQAFTRLGDPETMQFIEGILEYGSTLPEVLERIGGEMPVLFDIEKGLGDVGEALIAAAQTIAVMREEAQKEGWLGEFDRALMMILYRVFGIRNIRAFLTLSRVSLEEYRALRDTIAKASGAVEEYTQTVYASWQTTRQWASSAFANIRRLFGAEMIQFFNPILRFIGEFVNGLFLIGRQVPLVTALLGGLSAFVGTFISGAAAISSFVVVLSLLQGKLRDLGQRLLEAGELAGKIPETIAAAGPLAVGRWYVIGRYIPTLRRLASLALFVSFAFSAWRVAATGATQSIEGLGEALSSLAQKTGLGRIAGRMALWFQQAITNPRGAFQAFFGGIIRMAIYSLEWFGKVIKGTVDLIVKVFRTAGWVISKVGYGIKYAVSWVVGLGDVEAGAKRLHGIMRVLGQIFGFLLMATAARWIWRNVVISGVRSLLAVIKALLLGFKVLGKEIPGLPILAARAVGIVVRNIRAIWHLLVRGFGYWREFRRIHGPFRAFLDLAAFVFKELGQYLLRHFGKPAWQAIKNLIRIAWQYIMTLLVEAGLKRRQTQQQKISLGLTAAQGIFGWLGGGALGRIGGWLGRAGGALGGLLGKAWGAIGGLFAKLGGLLGKVGGAGGGLFAKLGWFLGKAGGAIGGLFAKLGGLLSKAGGASGGLFAKLGGFLGRAGGAIGGLFAKLGGFLAPLVPHLWWIIPLIALLGGLGYGIYRLVTRPKPAPAPATTYQPVPPVTAGPAYATMNVNIAPTIIVPQGTTAEQAQAIMAQLEPQIVDLFKRLTWNEQLTTLERNMRAGLLTGVA
jgi:TP901 family phage tail tape measure protein